MSRPAWLKSRAGAAKPDRPETATPSAAAIDRSQFPQTTVPAMPAVEAAKTPFVRPRTLGGWVALVWQGIHAWWTGLYLGWGVITSLLIHATALLILAGMYFSLKSDRGMLIGGTFDEIREGEALDPLLDSRLDTSFGDNSASLEFLATSIVSDRSLMESAENLLGGNDGDGADAGDSEASMAMNVKVPESAITKGSFTVWTEPEDPKPRVPYHIVIQVKLPGNAKQYRLNDLSGKVVGTDGFSQVIRYPTNERRGIKDGVVQVTVRIPGAAQLVRDVIEVRSKLLKEEQTIEIVF